MQMAKPVPARRSTITDVARHANVSIKTVSRVVRQEPRVSDETRMLVKASMEALNYRPTIAARSTVSARSFLIGLVFDNPNPAYAIDLLRGAQKATRDNGYHLVVEPIEPDDSNLAKTIRDFVVQSNLDGIILPPPLCDRPDVLASISTLNCLIARIAPGTDPGTGFAVEIDDVAAAREMTEHLITLGHRRIGFVKGREGTATTRKRLEGYRLAIEAAGIGFDEKLVMPGRFDLQSGLEAGEQLLALQQRPTAIFASNDDMAAGVLIAALKAGLNVPADISVAGFDDSVTASAMRPRITTIRQPVVEMAAHAATRIIDFSRSPTEAPLKSERLDFALIERESTGPCPEFG